MESPLAQAGLILSQKPVVFDFYSFDEKTYYILLYYYESRNHFYFFFCFEG